MHFIYILKNICFPLPLPTFAAALKSYDTNQPQDLHDQQQQQQQLFCPRRFDGWTCWDAQPAGTVAENYCPNFVLGFDANRLAFRVWVLCARRCVQCQHCRQK